MDPVIIYQSDDPDHFSIALADFLLNQMIPNQIANGLGAVWITCPRDAHVERGEQVLFERDAEARQMVHA